MKLLFGIVVLLGCMATAYGQISPDGQIWVDDNTPVTLTLQNFNSTFTNGTHLDTVYPCHTKYFIVRLDPREAGSYFEFKINATATGLNVKIQANQIPSFTTITDKSTQMECSVGAAAPFECDINEYCEFDVAADYYISIEHANTGLADKIDYTLSFKLITITPMEIFENVAYVSPRNKFHGAFGNDDIPVENYDHFVFNQEITDRPGADFTVVLFDIDTNATVAPTLRINRGDLAINHPASSLECFSKLSCFTDFRLAPDGTPKAPPAHSATDCQATDTSLADGGNITMRFDPCKWIPGKYYISIEYPGNTALNYSIIAYSEYPEIDVLAVDTPTRDSVSDRASHFYSFEVTNATLYDRLVVTVDRLDGGVGQEEIGVYISRVDLPKGKDGCLTPEDYSETRWQGNAVIEQCDLQNAVYYIAVDALQLGDPPLEYTITAQLITDPLPMALTLGDYLSHESVEEKIYQHYTVDLSASVGSTDATFFLEVFGNEIDTPITIFARPGTNRTGTPVPTTISGDVCPNYLDTATWTCQIGVGKESCVWMIKTCDITENTLHISVYGEATGYQSQTHLYAGSNTYYGRSSEYTIWTAVQTPVTVNVNQSYSESVAALHYQHYKLNIPEDTPAGTTLRVFFTDVEGGTIDGYIQFATLAGACPCYSNLAASASCANKASGTSCEMTIEACNLYAGDWYFSAYGESQLNNRRIGYTFTVVLDPPQPVEILGFDNTYVNSIGLTNAETDHFYLGRKSTAGDLQINIIVRDAATSLTTVRLGHTGLATSSCSEWTCTAQPGAFPNKESYCTIYVPDCKWGDAFGTGDYFLSVTNVGSTVNVPYTLETSVIPSQTWALTAGVATSRPIDNWHYHDYSIAVDATAAAGSTLIVEVFFNRDQTDFNMDVYLNFAAVGGETEACRTYSEHCRSQTFCHFEVENCDLNAGTYYASVFGGYRDSVNQHFYDIDVEYTIKAWYSDSIIDLTQDQPMTNHVFFGDLDKYRMQLTSTPTVGQNLVFRTANIRHTTVGSGAVVTYLNNPANGTAVQPAGPCPCYTSDSLTSGSDEVETSVPYCVLNAMNPQGTSVDSSYWYVSVKGNTATANTVPVGYVMLAELSNPNVTDTSFGDSNVNHTLVSEQYWHYRINSTGASPQVIGARMKLTFRNITDGTLSIYIRKDKGDNAPADADSRCNDESFACPEGDLCELWTNPCDYDSSVDSQWWVSVKGNVAGKPYVQYTFEPTVDTPTDLGLYQNLQNAPIEANRPLIKTTSNWQHFRFPGLVKSSTERFRIELSNANTTLEAYIAHGAIAGVATCTNPCFKSLKEKVTCASGTNCTIEVSQCQFAAGDWFLAIRGSGTDTYYRVAAIVEDFGATMPNETLGLGATDTTNQMNQEGSWRYYAINVNATMAGSEMVIDGWINTASNSNSTTKWGGYLSYGVIPDTGCYDYSTNSNSSFKITVPSCCNKAGTWYYGVNLEIDVTGNFDFTLTSRGTILETAAATLTNDTIVVVDANNATVHGVLPYNYQHYSFTPSANVFTNLETVYVNITNIRYSPSQQPSANDSTTLEVYMRAGVIGGRSDCFATDSPVMSPSSPRHYIRYTLPACALTSGQTWYVSMYNPTNTEQWYEINMYTEAPLQLTLSPTSTNGTSTWENNTIVYDYGRYRHFFVDVPAGSIAQAQNLKLEVVQASTAVNFIDTAFYVRFGALAGIASDSSTPGCYASDFTGVTTFNAETAVTAIDYCYLINNNRWGRWYISVKTNGTDTTLTHGGTPAEFYVRASVESNSYAAMSETSDLTPGSQNHRTWTFVASSLTPENSTDEAYYQFTIDPAHIGQTSYMIFNVSNVQNGKAVKVDLSLGCDDWSITVLSGYGIIDPQSGEDAGLTPCSLKSGTYLVKVTDLAPSNTVAQNYTIQAILYNAVDSAGSTLPPKTLVEGVKYPIENNTLHQVVAAPLSTYDYYHAEVNSTGDAASFVVTADVECGSIEIFVRLIDPDMPSMTAGPFCSTGTCTSASQCKVSLDTCESQVGNYSIVVRSTAQTYTSPHLNIPTRYNIWYSVDRTSVITAELECPLTWRDDKTQYKVWVPTMPFGSELHFHFSGSSGDTFYIQRNGPAKLLTTTTTCTDLFTKTLTGTGVVTDDTVLNPCSGIGAVSFQGGRDEGEWYFIRIDASSSNTWVKIRAIQYTATPIVDKEIYTYTIAEEIVSAQYFSIQADPTSTDWGITAEIWGVKDGEIKAEIMDGTKDGGTPCASSNANTMCTAKDADLPGTNDGSCLIVFDNCLMHHTKKKYYLKITVVSADTADDRVWYTFRVNTTQTVKNFPVNSDLCDNVGDDKSVFYRVTPAAKTANTWLSIKLSDIAAGNEVTIFAYSQLSTVVGGNGNSDLASPGCNNNMQCTANAGNNYQCEFIWTCPYDDLHITTRGEVVSTVGQNTNYLISVYEHTPDIVKDLTLGTAYTDSECDNLLDFYRITLTADQITSSYLRVTFGGEGSLSVSYDKYFDSTCADRACSASNASAIHECMVEFDCNTQAGEYFAIVDSTTFNSTLQGYWIKAELINYNYVNLTDTGAQINLAPGERSYFSYEVTNAAIDGEIDFALTNLNGGAAGIIVNFENPVGTTQASCYITNPTGSAAVDGSNTVATRYQDVTATAENCYYRSGTYYVLVWNKEMQNGCLNLTGTLTPVTRSLSITPTRVNNTVWTQGSLASTSAINYYRFTPPVATATSFGYFRIADVTGGQVRAYVSFDRLSVAGDCRSNFCAGSSVEDSCVDTLYKPNGFESGCTNTHLSYTGYGNEAGDVFFSVRSTVQDDASVPVAYNVTMIESTWTTLTNAVPVNTIFTGDNYQLAFFTMTTTTISGSSVNVDILSTSSTRQKSVTITLSGGDSCVSSARFIREITCEVGEDCTIEFSTELDHPMEATYFVVVKGKNTEFSTTFHAAGRSMAAATVSSGAPFCSPLTTPAGASVFESGQNYWGYGNLTSQNQEASCYYDWLLSQFTTASSPCIPSDSCKDALKRYSCYSTFRKTTPTNFITPICRSACEVIPVECETTWAAAGLKYLNCSESINFPGSGPGECTGRSEIVPAPVGNPPTLTGIPTPPVTTVTNSTGEVVTTDSSSTILPSFIAAVFTVFFSFLCL